MTETTKTLANGLRDVQRIITETDSSGKAVISKQLPTTSVWQKIDAFASFFLGYTTHSFPVLLTSASTDIASYSKDLSNPPGLTVSDGTVVRYVDMGPNGTSPMHKTMSVDYGVVLEGVIELVLDSGETRVMHRGDLCVQRGTNHAWRNITPADGWARMMYVLVAATGEGLSEDLGSMTNVKTSS